MKVSPQNLIWQPSHATSESEVQGTKIGVLALQGDFLEHANMLRRLGATPIEIRLPNDLVGLAGLIIPGGESTTIGKLALKFGLVEPLQQFVASQKIVWGTCAGMIFLAKEVGATGSGGHVVPLRLGMMDIVVNRNAFGRQIDSFEADLQLTFDRDVPFRAIFIRAPSIESCGPEVEILAELANGTPVAARQGNLLVSAFHPELTNDVRLHRYFLRMIQANKEVDHE